MSRVGRALSAFRTSIQSWARSQQRSSTGRVRFCSKHRSRSALDGIKVCSPLHHLRAKAAAIATPAAAVAPTMPSPIRPLLITFLSRSSLRHCACLLLGQLCSTTVQLEKVKTNVARPAPVRRKTLVLCSFCGASPAETRQSAHELQGNDLGYTWQRSKSKRGLSGERDPWRRLPTERVPASNPLQRPSAFLSAPTPISACRSTPRHMWVSEDICFYEVLTTSHKKDAKQRTFIRASLY